MNAAQEELRRLSKAAFNQTYRLEVMLAIADSDGIVTQRDVARSIDQPQSNVQLAFRSLIDCGLLVELPRADSRSRHLMRVDSPAWDWAGELRAKIELNSEASR